MHIRRLSKAFAVLAALVLLLAPLLAEARSGGSFGGGFKSRSSSSSRSFGGSSRSFGGSSYSPPSYRPSYSPPTYVPVPIPIGGGYHRPTYYSSSPTAGSAAAGVSMLLIFVLFFVGVVVVIIVVGKMRKKGEEKRDSCDVSLIQLGIQAQARAIQQRIEKLAETVDTSTEEGLAHAVRELALELRRHAEHIEYGALTKMPQLALPRAQEQFGVWAGNERSKYDREILRTDDMGRRTQQRNLTTDGLRDEDGELMVAEFFVVSLVLATRQVQLVQHLMGHQELEQLLGQLQGVRAENLVALEVVWSPAAESDTMSREEMELRYPEMMPI